MKFLYWFSCFMLLSCQTSPIKITPETAISDPKLPTCKGYVSKADCDDGDSVLFAGLLCLAQIEAGCLTVKASQGEDGRWWRSPRRNPDNIGKDNSFSRDMALGVLAYLTATKDRDAANNWWHWIENNRPCIAKIGVECIVYGIPRYCTDDTDNRCSITPMMFATMYRVWKYLDLQPPKAMSRFRDSPILKPKRKGYPLHLFAVHEYIRQRQGNMPNKEVTNFLMSQDSSNPFFVWLYQGRTTHFKKLVDLYCAGHEGDRDQWSWERDTLERAWYDSMVWDCLFIRNI